MATSVIGGTTTAEEFPSLTDFGAVSGTDCTVAFQAAINSGCQILFIPTGTWGYSTRLNFGGMHIIGTGPYSPGGSRLLCMNAAGIITCDSGARWQGIFIDGNGTGATGSVGVYGFIMGNVYSQFMHCEMMSVRYFTLYGFILDKPQNSTLLKVNCQYNAINFLFNNGARDIVLTGCNAALDISSSTGQISSHRNILMTALTDDPNLSTTSIGQSNSRILFEGGIFEYGNYATSNVELLVAGANSANDILFHGTEITQALDSGYLIDIEAGTVKFDGCQFNGDNNASTIHVASGAQLTLPGDGSYGGASCRGYALYNKGIVADIGSTVIFGRPGLGLPMLINSNMIGSLSPWTNVGAGTVTYNSSLCAIDVTWPYANTGAKLNWASNSVQIYAGQLFRIKGRITLQSGTYIPLLSFQLLSGSGGVIVSSVNGDFDVLYRMMGNESTAIQLVSPNGATEGTARIEAFTMEMMNIPR